MRATPGGALKNPLAIAAGIIEGLGFGYNTMAALVTRGCSEMRRLSQVMGGRPETLSTLQMKPGGGEGKQGAKR